MYLFIGYATIMIAVFCHELGHYLAAVAVRIPVKEFNVGVGPVVLSCYWRRTRWCLRLLPIGGYVVPGYIQEDVYAEGVIFFHLSGIIANVCLAVLAFTLSSMLPERLHLDLDSGGKWVTTRINDDFSMFTTTENSGVHVSALSIEVDEFSPNFRDFVEAGDNIQMVNGCILESDRDLTEVFEAIPLNKDLILTVATTDGRILDVFIPARYTNGTIFTRTTVEVRYDWQQAMVIGAYKTFHIAKDLPAYLATVMPDYVIDPNDSLKKLESNTTADTLSVIGIVSLLLAAINILPIPLLPLDGNKALTEALNSLLAYRWLKFVSPIIAGLGTLISFWFVWTCLVDFFF